MIRQISVFVQNKAGQLSKILNVLAENKIDIRSMTIAESEDYGLLRLILSNTEQGLSILKSAGIMASISDVMACEIPDRPGGLANLVNALAAENINIAYTYSYWPIHAGKVIIVFKVPDEDIEKTKAVIDEKPDYVLLSREVLLQS